MSKFTSINVATSMLGATIALLLIIGLPMLLLGKC